MILTSELEPEFDPTVNNASLCVCINLGERWHLVRRENHLAKPTLASVCDVFEVDKETVLAERLFTEDPQDPKRFGSKAVTQKLIARVIGFESRLKVRLFFKKQR